MLASGLCNGKCKTCRKDITFWSVPCPVSEISFTVNGTQHIVTNPDPEVSLNEWIRNQPGLQGKSHIELNIIFGKSHSTAFNYYCFVFQQRRKFHLK